MSNTRMERFARRDQRVDRGDLLGNGRRAFRNAATNPFDSPPSGDAGVDVTIAVPIVKDRGRLRRHASRAPVARARGRWRGAGALAAPFAGHGSGGAVDVEMRGRRRGAGRAGRDACRASPRVRGTRRARAATSAVRRTRAVSARTGTQPRKRAAVASVPGNPLQQSQITPAHAALIAAGARTRGEVGVGIASRQSRARRAGSRETPRRARSRPAREIRSNRWCTRRSRRRRARCAAAGRACRPARAFRPASGVKRRRILSGSPALQREIALRAEAPAAAAEALQQEHVVGIHVRPDPSAGRGVAHHEVVQARERQERKPAQQRVARGSTRLTPWTSSVQLRAGSAAKSARRNGPCARDQRVPCAHDEARFDVVAPREREELAQR